MSTLCAISLQICAVPTSMLSYQGALPLPHAKIVSFSVLQAKKRALGAS